jgi:hypothetical protein
MINLDILSPFLLTAFVEIVVYIKLERGWLFFLGASNKKIKIKGSFWIRLKIKMEKHDENMKSN